MVTQIESESQKQSQVILHRGGTRFHDKVIIKSKTEITLLDQRTILYLQSSSNYCLMLCADGKKICASRTLGHYERVLLPRFVRVHSSYIINLQYVDRVDIQNNLVYLKEGHIIPVSRSRKKAFLNMFK